MGISVCYTQAQQQIHTQTTIFSDFKK